MTVVIIIPIFNPDKKFIGLLNSLKKQTFKDYDLLIIDSSDDDRYCRLKKWDERIRVIKINADVFNHGGTRQLGVTMYPDKDIYVFFTQDAMLSDENSLENLINVFNEEKVGCAYGRQIPYEKSSFFSKTARLINYPHKSYVRRYIDKYKYGIKTVFISNSFAAYRNKALGNVGGFPRHVILGEDMWVAAKMIMQDWEIAYVSNALVYHSHEYSILQEFKRYFDIGAFHAREKWINEEFGGAKCAGYDYIRKEFDLISQEEYHGRFRLFIEMLLRNIFKFMGYKLGGGERYIPRKIKKNISMTKKYW